MKKQLTISLVSALLISIAACSPQTAQSAQDGSPSTEEQHMKVTNTHLNAVQASALIAADNTVVILDVRTPKEFGKGHIEGAVNVDFYGEDFKQQLSQLDKDTHYLVHCRSGGRSTKSMTTFKELGFTQISHMDGGIKAWKKAKLPIVK